MQQAQQDKMKLNISHLPGSIQREVEKITQYCDKGFFVIIDYASISHRYCFYIDMKTFFDLLEDKSGNKIFKAYSILQENYDSYYSCTLKDLIFGKFSVILT